MSLWAGTQDCPLLDLQPVTPPLGASFPSCTMATRPELFPAQNGVGNGYGGGLCAEVCMFLSNPYAEALTQEPLNVNVFGDGVFKEVVKVK